MDDIGDMVLRLVGDASSYTKMFDQAQGSVKDFSGSIDSAARDAEKASASFEGFAAGVAKTLGAVGLSASLNTVLKAFQGQEDATLKLQAALEANGRSVESLMADYNAFAGEMQSQTVVQDDTILRMLQMAESYGITGDAAKRAAQNAVALAAAKGGEATSYVRLTAALEQGNAEMLRRHIPALRGVQDRSEQVRIAQESLARMFSVARAEAGTSAGQLKQFANVVNDLQEELGAVVARVISPFVAGLRQVVLWLQATPPAVKEGIVAVMGLSAAWLGLGPATKVVNLMLGPVQAVGASLLTWLNPLKLITVSLYLVRAALGSVGAVMKGIGLGALVAGAAMLVEALGGFEEVWGGIRDAALGAWDSISAAVADFAADAWPVIQAVGLVLQAAWTAALEAVQELWPVVTGFFADAWQWTVQLAGATVGWVSDFVAENEELIGTLAAVVGAVTGAYVAYRVFGATLAVVNAVLTFFKVQQALSIALWLAWKTVVVAAWAAIIGLVAVFSIHDAIIITYNALTMVAAAVTSAMTAAVVIAKAAFVALAAVITVTNVAMVAFAAAWGAVGALAVAALLAVIASAAWAAYQAVRGLFGLFAGADLSGPLQTISGVLGQWWEYVQLIARAVRTDMTLAWEIARAAFQVALLQVQAMWPPIWDFIRTGFELAWDYVTGVFVNRFTRALQQFRLNALNEMSALQAQLPGLNLILSTDAVGDAQRDATNRIADLDARFAGLGRGAEVRLGEATRALGRGLEAGLAAPEVGLAQDEVARLRGQLDERERLQELARQQQNQELRRQEVAAGRSGEAQGRNLARGLERGTQGFQAVLRNSAEAQARINEHMERIRMAANRAGAAAGVGAGAGGPAGRPAPAGLTAAQQAAVQAAGARAAELNRRARSVPLDQVQMPWDAAALWPEQVAEAGRQVAAELRNAPAVAGAAAVPNVLADALRELQINFGFAGREAVQPAPEAGREQVAQPGVTPAQAEAERHAATMNAQMALLTRQLAELGRGIGLTNRQMLGLGAAAESTFGGVGAAVSTAWQGITRFVRREQGGPVRARQPYIVGESGVELFVPWTDGTVLPNEDVLRLHTAAPLTAGATQPLGLATARSVQSALAGMQFSTARPNIQLHQHVSQFTQYSTSRQATALSGEQTQMVPVQAAGPGDEEELEPHLREANRHLRVIARRPAVELEPANFR